VSALTGTHSAAAIAIILSSIGLRVPYSSPDSVALPTPAGCTDLPLLARQLLVRRAVSKHRAGL